MKKLNKKKIKWIVKEVEKRKLGVWTIARVQKISKQHAYRVAKKFKSNEPELKKCGRKPRRITDDERKIVIRAYKEIRASAVIVPWPVLRLQFMPVRLVSPELFMSNPNTATVAF